MRKLSPPFFFFCVAVAIFAACSNEDVHAPAASSDAGSGDSSPRDGASSDAVAESSTDAGGPDAVADSDSSADSGDAAASDAPDDAADSGDAAALFALTSSAFADGGRIPVDNTCSGADDSPPLAWTAGPPGTQSYAIVVTDLSSIPPNYMHWVIYDIPAADLALPAAIPFVYEPPAPAGAKQSTGDSATYGYFGPCPPGGSGDHTYQFVVYAFDVANLAGVTPASTGAFVAGQIAAQAKASATLTGKYNR